MKKFLIVLFLISLTLTAFGQKDMNSGIIYGNNYSFGLTAPNGWVLDNESGISQGLNVVFYKKGESWGKAETVMYANTSSLEVEAHRTLDQLIKYDISDFKSNYSDIVITDGKDILTKDSVKAKIKYLSGNSYGNFEAMAYLDGGKIGVMIIMSSRTKEGFDNSLTAFEDLVRSYFFFVDKIIIDKKK